MELVLFVIPVCSTPQAKRKKHKIKCMRSDSVLAPELSILRSCSGTLGNPGCWYLAIISFKIWEEVIEPISLSSSIGVCSMGTKVLHGRY